MMWATSLSTIKDVLYMATGGCTGDCAIANFAIGYSILPRILSMTHIVFYSAQFLPYLPESCQVNPGAYGFELALWLSNALMRLGIVTSYPLGEDWGWFIEYGEGEAEFMIGCSSNADEGEGYLGQPILWSVFVQQVLSLKQRLRGQSAPVIAAKLMGAIVAVLKAEGIAVQIEEST